MATVTPPQTPIPVIAPSPVQSPTTVTLSLIAPAVLQLVGITGLMLIVLLGRGTVGDIMPALVAVLGGGAIAGVGVGIAHAYTNAAIQQSVIRAGTSLATQAASIEARKTLDPASAATLPDSPASVAAASLPVPPPPPPPALA